MGRIWLTPGGAGAEKREKFHGFSCFFTFYHPDQARNSAIFTLFRVGPFFWRAPDQGLFGTGAGLIWRERPMTRPMTMARLPQSWPQCRGSWSQTAARTMPDTGCAKMVRAATLTSVSRMTRNQKA